MTSVFRKYIRPLRLVCFKRNCGSWRKDASLDSKQTYWEEQYYKLYRRIQISFIGSKKWILEVLELEDQINALLEMFWKLEKTVKKTSSKNEILEDRLDYLEEELEAKKIQNIEVKNHLNSTIKQLNSLTLWVKRHFNHVPRIETTYEVDTWLSDGELDTLRFLFDSMCLFNGTWDYYAMLKVTCWNNI